MQVGTYVVISEPLRQSNQPEEDGKFSNSELPGEPVIANEQTKLLGSEQFLSEPPGELLFTSLKEDNNKIPEVSITSQDELPSELLIISDESSKEEASLVENKLLDSRTPPELLSNQTEDSKKLPASISLTSEPPGERRSGRNNKEHSNEEASSVLNNEHKSDLPGSTLESGNSQIPNKLTGAALARRLNVSPGSISRNKNKENFEQWASQHDPDGVTWHFDGEKFISVIPLSVEEKPL